jgi:LysM repeat protein
MKVSKVVLMVVALHVLVIGGIFIFEGCTRTKTPTELVDGTPQPPDITPTNSALPAVSGPGSDIASMTPTSPGLVQPVAPVTPVAPVATAPVSRTYTVKGGDSLTKIAKREKVTVMELAKANHLTKTSVLKIGQKLTIPAKADVTAIATAQPVTPVAPVGLAGTTATPVAPVGLVTTEGATYTVQSGDSLWKIAKNQNSSVSAIKQANNLTSDSLKIGQKLMIPAKAATTLASATTAMAVTPDLGMSVVSNGETVHTVDIGESPAVIAKRYNVKVADLMKANNITDPRRLQAGQTLRIPSTQPAPVAAPVAAPVTATAPVSTAPVAPAPAVLTAAPMAN